MSFIVVDCECFSEGVIKEVAIYKDNIVTGFSFLPPKFGTSHGARTQNEWLTTNFHYIDWNSGVYPYETMSETLSQYFWNTIGIEFFVKGLQKCQLFSNMFPGVHFVNLDDLGCPVFDELMSIMDEEEMGCSSYPFRHKNTKHCAEKKALAYAKWLELNFC